MKLTVAVAAIVVAQGIIYFAILDRTVGSSRWLGGATNGQAMFRVAVLRSDAASKLNPDHPEQYFDLARQWEAVLSEGHASYRIVNDKDIAGGLANSADVLVLPWAVCLDDAQRRSIESFVESGKGLVLSGATGARAGDCSWKGWDTLSRLTGLKNPSSASAPAPLVGAYTGGNFYSGSVPAGYQLPLANQEVVMGGAAKADMYAADYRLRPLEPAPGGTLAIHGVRGRGRFVWLGFPETTPVKDASGRGILNAYLFSAVQWVGRQPIAAVANWPKAAASAAVIASRVMDAHTAQSTMAVLRANQVRATFFLDARTASQAPDLVRSLAGLGEVASSGDTSDSFADQAASRQTARLADARRRMQNDRGLNLAGFAPPDSLWDDGTVGALRDAGFAYYLDRVNATRAVPELIAAPAVSFLPVRQVPLARLEAPFADDFEAMAESPTDAPSDRLWRDFQIVEKTGGAYILSFRSDLLGSAENAAALGGLLRGIKQRGAWMATGSDMAEWWIRRQRVLTDVRQVNDRRIRLAVSNSGSHPISDTSVYVYLPRVPSRLRVTALLGSGIPHYHVSQDGVLRLDFARLAARASYLCLISMDEK
jgi:peptidoglycan/xylan/chitin deacetylase (PgdA/CDA1 family)